MADDGQPSGGLIDRIHARNGWRTTSDRTNILRELTSADLLSLTALLVAWTSALLLLSGRSNLGIIVMFGAFFFDKLDGYWARKQEIDSAFGRQIDSYIDIFVYLVTGALLFHYTMAPNRLVSVVVGFAILAFGGLRLVRHNAEGFDSDGDVSYYHGTTVVHTNMLVVANYLLVTLADVWSGWLAALVILAGAPLMISEYRAPKTVGAHVLLGVLSLGVVSVCVWLML